MKVLLIDIDSKIPNLALMKLSAWHKAQGDEVILNNCSCKPDKIYASTIFTRSKPICKMLQKVFPNIEIGGTGWDVKKKLKPEVENMIPDYSLYGCNTGMGFSSRGCPNICDFCLVPKKEGKLKQATKITDIINPASRHITLLDNNFTADPQMLDKCQEIKERNLIVNLCQGVDIRIMTDEKAKALTSLVHKERINIAWDKIEHEKKVLNGIEILTQYRAASNIKCYILCGYNTTFHEDMYRFETLRKLGIVPYVMVYNDNEKNDKRLYHFERWVNGFCFYKCKFDDYIPWLKEE